MTQIVINGDNLELLKKYPDNYFDAVVTDPPYGLGKEPDAVEVMTAWATTGYHEIEGKGFMGKEWDAFVPQPVFWKEVFRVLKHGGHVVAFYGTRTYDWGVMAMRFAGFEVRDCIQWLYGSGFPKSHNISKAIDKMYGAEREMGDLKFKGGTQLGVINDDNWKPKDVYETFSATEEAKLWEGWGSALKPANEPIVLARKPLEKGLSIAENVLKWGTGGINIDGCRVGSEIRTMPIFSKDTKNDETTFNLNSNIQHHREETSQGRFPANIILTHHPECECKGVKKVKSDAHHTTKYNGKDTLYRGGWKDGEDFGNKLADENGQETVEDWNCHPDCPIKLLDEQSGISKSTGGRIGNKNGAYSGIGASGFTTEYKKGDAGLGDTGGASRFFYVAKASKSERNKGLEGFDNKKPMYESHRPNYETTKGIETPYAGAGRTGNDNRNNHPTVKPVKLMQYLVRLITPPNGIVLDPFCGSGTTGIACKLEGFEFVGMEQDPEYTKIAEARITNYAEEKASHQKITTKEELPKDTKNPFIQTELF